MPLFSVQKDKLSPVGQINFATEKQLQGLVQQNLGVVFNCRFVASEFSTGSTHAGRIDTLALSEDNNPVIIEYKKVESSELINQSLFYLAWLNDHRGDFQIAAQKALGVKTTIDWSDMRVICLAPNYKKYDLHAVQMMGTTIELWAYRFFANGTLYLEEVLQKSYGSPEKVGVPAKNPIMVAAGKKAALTKLIGNYSFEQHIKGTSQLCRDIALSVQEFVMGLDPAVEEAPKKLYVAYRTSQNIVCMEVQQKKVLLFVKLAPKDVKPFPANARDVSNIGHFGTGDLELTLRNAADVEFAKPLIRLAYERVGG